MDEHAHACVTCARDVREDGSALAPTIIDGRGRAPMHRRRSTREQCSHSLTYASVEYVIGHVMGAMPLSSTLVPGTVPFHPFRMR